MKNLFLSIAIVAVALMSACNSNPNEQKETTKVTETTVYNVTDLLQDAEQNIDKEVLVAGLVNHVCSHSGRRCFIESEDGENSIRVEAKEDIPRFERELVGSHINVKGIVMEHRLSTQEIDEWEASLETSEDPENGGEQCAAEMNNIKEMREWMKANGKDYFSTYYIDGLSYEVIK